MDSVFISMYWNFGSPLMRKQGDPAWVSLLANHSTIMGVVFSIYFLQVFRLPSLLNHCANGVGAQQGIRFRRIWNYCLREDNDTAKVVVFREQTMKTEYFDKSLLGPVVEQSTFTW